MYMGIVPGSSYLGKEPERYNLAKQDIFAIIDLRVKDNTARLSVKLLDEWYYKKLDKNPYTGEVIEYGKTKDAVLFQIGQLSQSFEKSLKTKSIEF